MLPTSICETLHCRGSWLFVAGPDKSLWSLMFVSDRGWVHNCLGVSRHDIHLPAFGYSNIARVIASATHQQHTAKARFTMIMGPSFLSATVLCSWEMISKSNVQYWLNIAALLVCQVFYRLAWLGLFHRHFVTLTKHSYKSLTWITLYFKTYHKASAVVDRSFWADEIPTLKRWFNWWPRDTNYPLRFVQLIKFLLELLNWVQYE